jgi:hypothetical protein
MQKTILDCFFFLIFLRVKSQVLDTVPSQEPSQRYTLKNGAIYLYNKPKLFDFITKRPIVEKLKKNLKNTLSILQLPKDRDIIGGTLTF